MQPFADSVPSLVISMVTFILGWFMGTAFGPLVEGVVQSGRPTSLAESIRRAQGATDWRLGQRWRNAMGPRTRSTTSSNDGLFIAVAVILVILYEYVRYSEIVVNTLIVLSAGVVLSATIALVTLWRRGVIDGRGSAIRILIGSLLGATGITSAIFLVHPLHHADALLTLHRIFFEHAAGPNSVEGIVLLAFIAYQLVGAILTIVALVVAIAYCVATVNAVYIEQRSVGHWAWLFGFWLTKWSVPRKAHIGALVLALISVAFTSGWVFALMESVSSPSV